MTSRLTICGVVLAALVIAVSGCGGDDGDDGAASNNGGNPSAEAGAGEGGSNEGGSADTEVTTSSLNQKQFVKQANAICRRESKDVLKEFKAYLDENEGEEQPPGELYAGMVKAVFVPQVEAEVEKVQALGAPKGDEERLEEIFERQEEAIDEVAEIESLDDLSPVEDYFAEVDEEIRDYGHSLCTNSSDPSFAAE